MGDIFTVAFNYHGTLSADCQGQFHLYQPATLIHVSFCASNASDATLDVGDAGDADGIIDGGACGDSGTPAEFGPAEFNGALCDQVSGYNFPSDDEIVKFSIDYDGASGTAAQNVTLVFTFLAGGP